MYKVTGGITVAVGLRLVRILEPELIEGVSGRAWLVSETQQIIEPRHGPDLGPLLELRPVALDVYLNGISEKIYPHGKGKHDKHNVLCGL
jgi:hypothetical protein